MKLFTFVIFLVPLIGQIRADYNCTVVPGNNTVEIEDCSQFPVFFDPTLMTKCNSDFPAAGDLPIGICTAQCLLNATSVIATDTGKVDQTLFQNFVTTKSQGDWAGVSAAALATCFKLLIDQTDYINGLIPDPATSTPYCHPESAVLISCMYTQLFINTPDSQFNQKANSVCPDLKNFVKNCAV